MKNLIKLIIVISIIIITFNPVNAQSPSSVLYLNCFIDNEVYPANAFINKDLSSPLKLGKNVNLYYNNELQYMVNSKNNIFYFGYIRKNEEIIEADKETIKYLYESLNNESLSKSDYDFIYSQFSQQLEGIIMGSELITSDKGNFSATANIKILEGRKLKISRYNGQFARKSNILTAKRTYIDSENGTNTKMHDVNPGGQGYSFSINLQYIINNDESIKLTASDFFSNIVWEDIYIQEGNLNTDNITKDDEGFFQYDPVFSGSYKYSKTKTSLVPEYKLIYNHGNNKAGLLYKEKLYPFFSIMIIEKKLFNDKLLINTGLYKNFISLGISYNMLKANFKTKSLDFNKSSGYAANVCVNINF